MARKIMFTGKAARIEVTEGTADAPTEMCMELLEETYQHGEKRTVAHACFIRGALIPHATRKVANKIRVMVESENFEPIFDAKGKWTGGYVMVIWRIQDF